MAVPCLGCELNDSGAELIAAALGQNRAMKTLELPGMAVLTLSCRAFPLHLLRQDKRLYQHSELRG